MKPLRTILLFLLLGAVVNVGVAWGLAAWPPSNVDTWHSMTDIVDVFGVESFGGKPRDIPRAIRRVNKRCRPDSWSPSFAMFGGSHRSGVDFYYLDSRDDRRHSCRTHAVLAGWPLRSLWAHGTRYVHEAARVDEESASGTLWTMDEFGQCIPGLPCWPGFAVNSIMYGGVLWLVFVGRKAMIRRLRGDRGFCPHCAYDLRGGEHERCPECGADCDQHPGRQ